MSGFTFGGQAKGLFGGTTTTTASSFGGFGATTTVSTAPSAFGGFGTTTNTAAGGFGAFTTQTQQQQQQQHQQQAGQVTDDLVTILTSVTNPVLFGDERDALVAKWNQLQALWGSGKGFFNQQGQAAAFTPESTFCRFKAVGYSCKPSSSASDGLVSVIVGKPAPEVQKQQQGVVEALARMLGSKPGVAICVDSVKPLGDDKTEVVLYAQERQPTGATKRANANDLFQALVQPTVKTQLQTQLSVTDVIPRTGIPDEQLKAYLEQPPSGIDPVVWQQARLDNPDPDRLIPVPMVGFSELATRLKHQSTQTVLHQKRLKLIDGDITDLQRAMTDMQAKCEQYKRKHMELTHRVLQVMVSQEIHRKQGFAIQAEEEQLRGQLEALQASLNAPMQFKGRLNEMMSQLRMQNQLGVGSQGDVTCTVDSHALHEMKVHLKQQQEGLQHLIKVIKDDLNDLRLMEEDYLTPASNKVKPV